MAYKGYQFYEGQIANCDKQISNWLKKNLAQKQKQAAKSPTKKIRHHAPQIKELHGKMVQLFEGKDVSGIPGITHYTWLQLTAETGLDLSAWSSAKNFVSWLDLSPQKHSSGKINRNKKENVLQKQGKFLKKCLYLCSIVKIIF